MDLERERGITIKSHAIQMEYTIKGKNISWTWLTLRVTLISLMKFLDLLRLARSTFIVDAAQSIQAQTISIYIWL
jgi:GTP-binding protein LepA